MVTGLSGEALYVDCFLNNTMPLLTQFNLISTAETAIGGHPSDKKLCCVNKNKTWDISGRSTPVGPGIAVT